MTLRLRLSSPSIGGHERLVVGRKVYGIPRGSRFVHTRAHNKPLAYVEDLNHRDIHAFTEHGEVKIPPALSVLIREKYFPD